MSHYNKHSLCNNFYNFFRFCHRGQVNCCKKDALATFVGIARDGGWAEYVCVPAKQVGKIPENTDFQQALLAEPLSCIVNGWNNNGMVRDDDKILVMGAGIIGLLWSCLFHHHGYRDVTICEVLEGRRKIAEGLGLGYRVCDPTEIQKEMSTVQPEFDGFDLIVDATGNKEVLHEVFLWLRRRGKINIFGLYNKNDTSTINPSEFVLREVSIVGSLLNCFTHPQAVRLTADMGERYLDYSKLGIELFSLDEHQRAFKELQSGRISKAVFRID